MAVKKFARERWCKKLQLQISMTGDPDAQALASLKRWLSQDPDVVRSASLSTRRQAVSHEQMDAVFDMIIAAVSNATAIGSLVIAYQSWRDSRTKSPSTTLECNGVVIHLSESTPEEIEQIVAALTRKADD